MQFQVRQDGVGVVTVQGSLDSSRAVSFRKALLEALDSAGTIEIDLSAVESVGILSVQLICSAIRTARKVDKEVRLSGNPSPALDKAMEECGYQDIRQCG